MIKNERQYRITKAQEAKFADALLSLARARKEGDSARHRLQEAALRSKHEELQSSLVEYESLRANPGLFELHSLDDFPRTLIKARIASGLSHKELASRLGLKEQQIQRYEATDYAGVSIERARELCGAMGIEVRQEVLLPAPPRSVGYLLKRLKAVGIDRAFLETRLLPRRLGPLVAKASLESTDAAVSLAEYIGRIYNWSVEKLFSDEPLSFDNAVLSAVRYKRSKRSAPDQWTAYTIYAHYLGLLVLQCTKSREPVRREMDPEEVQRALAPSPAEISLDSVLTFLWARGIPVLPLRDAGAFHGAWWREDHQDLVVVKQRTSSFARWIVDILHEYFHVIDPNTSGAGCVVEQSDVLADPASSAIEQEATQFALSVCLGGQQEQLWSQCADEAKGKVEWLKNALPRVAKRTATDPAMLANSLAYRLSQQDINWWPTARGFDREGDPWSVAVRHLHTHCDFGKLATEDRELLEKALMEG